jgi:hypothetical protein
VHNKYQNNNPDNLLQTQTNALPGVDAIENIVSVMQSDKERRQYVATKFNDIVIPVFVKYRTELENKGLLCRCPRNILDGGDLGKLSDIYFSFLFADKKQYDGEKNIRINSHFAGIAERLKNALISGGEAQVLHTKEWILQHYHITYSMQELILQQSIQQSSPSLVIRCDDGVSVIACFSEDLEIKCETTVDKLSKTFVENALNKSLEYLSKNITRKVNNEKRV